MNALTGKVAVVTGAGSGMGEAVAQLFVAEGALVVCADVSGEEERVAEELGDTAVAVHVDVSQSADIERMIGVATGSFGALDILCNVAGIPSNSTPIVDVDEDHFMHQVDVHLRATFLGMKFGIREMLRAGNGGSVINWTSTASIRSFWGTNGYSASKAAISNLTRLAAFENGAANVRVNAILPGSIVSGFRKKAGHLRPEGYYDKILERTALRRFGQPSEIAQVALFLASDASSFVTGAEIPVDGGLTL